MIPKKIHLSWKDKDLLESKSELVQLGVKQLAALNPDWEMVISTDDEVDQYLSDSLPPEDYDRISDRHIVQKTDLWRLIKLHAEGGLYVDIDRFCNVKLDDLIDADTKWVLPTYRDYDFSHDFMMTAPGNPAFYLAVSLYLQRLKEGHKSVYFLGPQTYMHAVTQTLTGEMVQTDPGIEKFNEIRNIISQSKFIKTFRENSPHETILYRDGDTALDLEQLKRQFYADSGLRHWTGEW
jgi:mannosyltransferase OCH1-like enzyme